MNDGFKEDRFRRSQARVLQAQYHRADRVQGRNVRFESDREARRAAQREIREAILNNNSPVYE